MFYHVMCLMKFFSRWLMQSFGLHERMPLYTSQGACDGVNGVGQSNETAILSMKTNSLLVQGDMVVLFRTDHSNGIEQVEVRKWQFESYLRLLTYSYDS